MRTIALAPGWTKRAYEHFFLYKVLLFKNSLSGFRQVPGDGLRDLGMSSFLSKPGIENRDMPFSPSLMVNDNRVYGFYKVHFK